MYSESRNQENRITHKPSGHQSNASKGKILVDNRPITQLQKKNTLIKKPNVNGVVQRVLDIRTEASLVIAIRNNNKKVFKRIFRSADPGMDEMISCEVTYQKCRTLYKAGENAKMRKFLRASHATRHSTHGMGHIVKRGGRIEEFAHPTSKKKAYYARKRTAKGNPRWLNHTSWDRERSSYVRKSRSIRGMRDRSIEFSYNSGAQPPYASNSYRRRSRKAEDSETCIMKEKL